MGILTFADSFFRTSQITKWYPSNMLKHINYRTNLLGTKNYGVNLVFFA